MEVGLPDKGRTITPLVRLARLPGLDRLICDFQDYFRLPTTAKASAKSGLQARCERRELFWSPPYFGVRNFLVDVEIPPDDHFTAIPSKHLFQKLFGR
jgi:hypothetical protein